MRVTQKWRPSLGLLIAVVVGFLVILPLAALVGARVTSNQFARETEKNLHVQAAVFAALYAQAFEAQDPSPAFGTLVDADTRERLSKAFHPIDPTLTLTNRSILPPRPDPKPLQTALLPTHQALSALLSDTAAHAKKTTLAGYIATDHLGQIIAKSGGDDGSLAHIDEVAKALSGEIVTLARWRTEEYRNHSIRSISRDTKFRVFVVHPVIVADRVVGTVYLSRTPSNLNKYLFQQRNTFSWLFVGLALSALLVGLFLWRFLTRPLRGLSEQAAAIAQGNARERLPNYGVSEIASLGQSIMDMGASLRTQSAALETYTKHATHELKSPVTSIIGAAELLENPSIKDERRLALAATIKSDAARMDHLLQSMRDMVRARIAFAPETVNLKQIKELVAANFEMLDISLEGDITTPLPFAKDAAKICLHHLLQNAHEHGASAIALSYEEPSKKLKIKDNGQGLSAANAKKATEPFFTTKRDHGGTGLGLAICSEIVAQFGGTLDISSETDGALVVLSFEQQHAHSHSHPR